jgi:hypothetical protein
MVSRFCVRAVYVQEVIFEKLMIQVTMKHDPFNAM